MNYPVKLVQSGGVIMVTCPDLPEFASVGDDEVEALANAVDGIETTLQAYMRDRRPIPVPSARRRGYHLIRLPALAVAKLGLWQAMQEQGLRKADLARALDVHMPQVDRLLDLRHSSRLEQVEAALEALGRRIELTVLAA